jgi:crossover junction endodeoxyribonuclease RuvC
VIESDGLCHRMVVAGVIRTSPRWPFEKRLVEIANGLRGLIREHQPELAAVEGIFHAVNVKSALKLAQVRGVALLVIGEAGIGLAEYSPLEVKMSVVGYGRAEKSQVQLMVCSLLGLTAVVESFDASDALAVAICHAARESTSRRLVR